MKNRKIQFNIFNSLKNYIRESYLEMKKVVWPSKEETVKLSVAVILISLAVAAFLGALDFIFHLGVEKILSFS